MKAVFLIALLVACVAAQEAAPIFSLENFNNPEKLRAIADAQEPTFTACASNGAYAFNVSDLLAQPFPIIRGQDATMIMVGDASASIDLSNLRITTMVKTVSINVQNLSQAGKSLPAGESRFVSKLNIPSYAPDGSYTIKMELFNTAGAVATCIDIPITLG